MSTQELLDGELIELYRKQRDENAFRVLLNRYYDKVFYQLIGKCKHRSDAEDMLQQVWIRVIDNIENYEDQGKFSAFLSTIATNLLNDYWRRKGVRDPITFQIDDESEQGISESNLVSPERSPEDIALVHQQLEYLVGELIPQLPCEQRMVYLLRHESEHWDDKDRLEWSHLAEMNGISKEQAWGLFDEARKKFAQGRRLLQRLIQSNDLENNLITEAESCDLSCEQLLVFMVWTQAQRASKNRKFTEDDIADLIGIPVNTVKTRYRAAIRRLADGLQAFAA